MILESKLSMQIVLEFSLTIHIISRMKDKKLQNQISKIKIVVNPTINCGAKYLAPRFTGWLFLHFAFCTLTYALILAGCSALPEESPGLTQNTGLRTQNSEHRTILMEIAEDVLTDMYFTIDKFDPNSGFIRTRPLPGAQFFELWRSENIGAKNQLNSNLHSIRRTVEIILRRSQDASYVGCSDEALAKLSSTDELSCIVRLQRLSLPARDVTSSTQAYRMFSMSGPGLQTLQLHPAQEKKMAWLDLGRDTALEKEILKRIENQLSIDEGRETRDD